MNSRKIIIFCLTVMIFHRILNAPTKGDEFTLYEETKGLANTNHDSAIP